MDYAVCNVSEVWDFVGFQVVEECLDVFFGDFRVFYFCVAGG